MIEEKRFLEMAIAYGTPTYVFDADEVRERARAIRAIMNENASAPIHLCYSIKANPLLIPTLVPEVDYLEVCSPGELAICKAYEVEGSRILYSGVHKEAADIAEAIEYGARVLTAESIRHYELIEQEASRLDKATDVILRLSAQSQFGMSLSDIKELLARNKSANEHIHVIGIHYFAGTQRTNLKHQNKELLELQDTISALREEFDMELPWFEYGPGLGYPYFTKDDFSDTFSPLKELAPALCDAAFWSNLTVEMGRFLASSCGYYLTRVCDLKNSYDHNWCILDGGINHVNYLGQMMGMKNPVITRLPIANTEGEMVSYTLCGSLCTTNDILVREYQSKPLSVGDVLVFANVGAYSITEGLNLFLSRTMPKVVIFDGGRELPVRDAIETWEINLGRR